MVMSGDVDCWLVKPELKAEADPALIHRDTHFGEMVPETNFPGLAPPPAAPRPGLSGHVPPTDAHGEARSSDNPIN